MTLPYVLLAILVAFIGGIAIATLYHTIQDLRREVRELKAANAQRLPYAAAESIENASAGLVRLKAELDFKQSLVDNVLGHLGNARNPGKVKR